VEKKAEDAREKEAGGPNVDAQRTPAPQSRDVRERNGSRGEKRKDLKGLEGDEGVGRWTSTAIQ
jgi:hypothetical protein